MAWYQVASLKCECAEEIERLWEAVVALGGTRPDPEPPVVDPALPTLEAASDRLDFTVMQEAVAWYLYSATSGYTDDAARLDAINRAVSDPVISPAMGVSHVASAAALVDPPVSGGSRPTSSKLYQRAVTVDHLKDLQAAAAAIDAYKAE